MAAVLGELFPGESGVVRRVAAADAALLRRLTDMGITPLTEIGVVRVAPLGDPIEVRLRGYALSLRRADAMTVELMTERERAEAERTECDAAQRARQTGTRTPPGRPAGGNGHAAAQAGDGARFIWQDTTGDCALCGACGGCRGIPAARRRKPGRGASAPERPAPPLRLALTGNPNCGKTTLFNAVTGARETVGNWPGVTVEKKERHFAAGGREMRLMDLPGIYSLSSSSAEEAAAQAYLLEERPDAILNIVDATNLERNLYLTVQLLETERPVVVALNMMDEVRRGGMEIDCLALSHALGAPVTPVCARTGEGVAALFARCAAITPETTACRPVAELYDAATEAALARIASLAGDAAARAGLPARFAAVRLLEGDVQTAQRLSLPPAQAAALGEIRRQYDAGGSDMDAASRMADARYRWIGRICRAAVRRRAVLKDENTDRIDRILTGKWTGLPIFLLLMGLIFLLTFDTLGAFLSDGMERLIGGFLQPWAAGALQTLGAADWLTSMLCEGVIAGVGGVLTFLPQIALLFFFLSLLEDSGYLARTAFLMDRALRRFGLSGKAFIPLLMGFGCTVPAAMSARTMEHLPDRRMTILLLPFVSCSAKLPVYSLMAASFFPGRRALMLLCLYLTGLVCGVFMGVLYKKTVFRDAAAPFVLELPPYRLPSLKNTLLRVGERVSHFLCRAGSVILLMSLVLWALMQFGPDLRPASGAAESLLGRMGGALAPGLAPLGFGSWQAAVALLCGLVAKEAVGASLALFLGGAGGALPMLFTPAAAYAFCVFVLLYVPCAAAVIAMYRELRGARYTALLLLVQTALAYLAALAAYALGTLLS